MASMSIPKLFDDPRPIQAIWGNDLRYEVGMYGVTKIEVYEEPGQMGWIPWFAVYRGDKLLCRVNGMSVQVVLHGEAESDAG